MFSKILKKAKSFFQSKQNKAERETSQVQSYQGPIEPWQDEKRIIPDDETFAGLGPQEVKENPDKNVRDSGLNRDISAI
jgi:hypothetical protein